MRNGDIGASGAARQRHLNASGQQIGINSIFDEATEQAVIAFQRQFGLVADGIVGQKTIAALTGNDRDKKLLSEADLEAAADRLGVPVAAMKAVNEVESNGHGFLDDGRPVILYERHVAYRLLSESEFLSEYVEAIAEKYPNLINRKRGGYAGKEGEWARLASVRQIIAEFGGNPQGIPDCACSWGQFQIMGYHWEVLGYASPKEFVDAMHRSEADQLDAFVRFIETDPALLKALKGKKWAEFAKLYNGPAYKENLYDIKLARAYERHSLGAPA